MTFANPEAFFLLPLLVLFGLVAIINFQKKRRLLNAFISPVAYKRLGVRSGSEIDFFKAALSIAALFFFILALAGPQWGEELENVDIRGIEALFLFDTSGSMNAEDLKPNRLEFGKTLIMGIVDNLQTDYLGLVNFAGKPYMQCPFTVDYGAFKLLVEATSISPPEEQGTDVGEALRLGLKAFSASRSEQKLMVLITDGEDHEKGWQELVPELKKLKIIVFTIGVGATGGAPIPVTDSSGEVTGWKKDKQGEIVMTRLDESTLVEIAARTGGQYIRLTDSAGIDAFIRDLKDFERNVLQKKVNMKKKERFHYFLIIGLICLLLEFILTEKRLTWAKKQ